MTDKVQLTDLQAMKRDGQHRSSASSPGYYQIARSRRPRGRRPGLRQGDTASASTCGANPQPARGHDVEATLVVCQGRAPRCSAKRSIVSCGISLRPCSQEGPESACAPPRIRLVKEGRRRHGQTRRRGGASRTPVAADRRAPGIPGCSPSSGHHAADIAEVHWRRLQRHGPIRSRTLSADELLGRNGSGGKAPRVGAGAVPFSTSPIPGPDCRRRRRRRGRRFRWSAASAAGPWLDGRMRMVAVPPSATAPMHWTRHRIPTPMSRRSRTMRSSLTPMMCGHRAGLGGLRR